MSATGRAMADGTARNAVEAPTVVNNPVNKAWIIKDPVEGIWDVKTAGKQTWIGQQIEILVLCVSECMWMIVTAERKVARLIYTLTPICFAALVFCATVTARVVARLRARQLIFAVLISLFAVSMISRYFPTRSSFQLNLRCECVREHDSCGYTPTPASCLVCLCLDYHKTEASFEIQAKTMSQSSSYEDVGTMYDESVEVTSEQPIANPTDMAYGIFHAAEWLLVDA